MPPASTAEESSEKPSILKERRFKLSRSVFSINQYERLLLNAIIIGHVIGVGELKLNYALSRSSRPTYFRFIDGEELSAMKVIRASHV